MNINVRLKCAAAKPLQPHGSYATGIPYQCTLTCDCTDTEISFPGVRQESTVFLARDRLSDLRFIYYCQVFVAKVGHNYWSQSE